LRSTIQRIDKDLEIVWEPNGIDTDFFENYFEEELPPSILFLVDYKFKGAVSVEHIHEGRVVLSIAFERFDQDLSVSVALWVLSLGERVQHRLVIL